MANFQKISSDRLYLESVGERFNYLLNISIYFMKLEELL